MTKTKTKPAVEAKVMTATQFVREFASRQKPLLEAMRDAIARGEVQLEYGVKADRHVERIISNWCDEEQPDMDMHLQMLGAVFLTALYDELYAGEAEDGAEFEDEPKGAADVIVEALKTVRAIWGIHGSKS